MGGNAFPGYSTPRMSPETYRIVKARVQDALKPFFTHVTSPIEAPGKADFGDVDAMACTPLGEAIKLEDASKAWKYSAKAVGDLIGAVESKRVGKLDSWNFVMPWPEDLEYPVDASIDVSTSSNNRATLKYHIQVDIDIPPTYEEYKWHEFLHAHGDFWNVIGHMLRKFDIIATDKGLHLVIPEIADTHKTLARVLATRDPSLAMKYLGFDEERFWRRFKKWEDVCAFIATCRFHDAGRNRHRYEAAAGSSEEGTPAMTPDGSMTPVTGVTASVADSSALNDVLGGLQLTKTDRARYKKRPMLKHWFDVYRPAHLDDAPGTASHYSHEQILEDATTFFGAEFVDRYQTQKQEGLRFAFEPKLWRETREYVKSQTEDSSEITMATKCLKRMVTEQPIDADWAEVEDLEDVRRSFSALDFDGLMVWWKVKWASVAARQREFDRLKSAASYKAKMLKEAELAASAGGTDAGGTDAGSV